MKIVNYFSKRAARSYPSFQLGLVYRAVVEQKADGVDLADVFVDDVRTSRVVVT